MMIMFFFNSVKRVHESENCLATQIFRQKIPTKHHLAVSQKPACNPAKTGYFLTKLWRIKN